MQGIDFRHFVDTFDFEQLMQFFTSGDYLSVIHNPVFIGVAAVFLVLIAYYRTREFGTTALTYILVGLVYVVGGIVIKNSRITDLGPFLLLLALSLGAVGYLIFSKLLLNR